MNPYLVLGIEPEATGSQIKAAYRKRSAETHPDTEHGTEEKFHEVKLAFDILSNKDRRERYDRTGRTDDVKITPKVVQSMIEQTVTAMINAERPDGTTDDPTWENIKSKVIATIKSGRREVETNINQVRRKIARLDNLAKRFKSRTESDPVGDAFAAQRKALVSELHKFQDGLELSIKTQEVFASYDYEVGETAPEGQSSPASPFRLGGPQFLPRDIFR